MQLDAGWPFSLPAVFLVRLKYHIMFYYADAKCSQCSHGGERDTFVCLSTSWVEAVEGLR